MIDLITKLRSAPSNACKFDLLRGASQEWIDVLVAAYGDATYGVAFKTLAWNAEVIGTPDESMFAILRLLATRKLSGRAARIEVTKYADTHGNLIQLICNRNLDCGVTATTINKAIPGLIYVLKAQKAKAIPISALKFPCFAELKYDGVRMLIICTKGEVMFKTYNGKTVHLPLMASRIQAALSTNVDGLINWVLDSEVTVGDGKLADRPRVTGYINSAIRGNQINEELLNFNVFDCLTLPQFTSAKCPDKYGVRRNNLYCLLSFIDVRQLSLAWQKQVHCLAGVETLYASVIEQGYEGLMIKHGLSKYEFKRSAAWVKLKEVKTADLQCTSVIPGQGRFAGEIGALSCSGVVEGIHVSVNVGSGLTNVQRSIDDAKYVGKTIELKYNSITKDARTGEFSLFLPRFVCVREDK